MLNRMATKSYDGSQIKDGPCFQIIVVMDRLESFPLDTPLMKFLTGLELLLETCQEWEKNAHAGVSIAMSLMEITHLIIEWRKLELSFWKNLVETTYQRYEREFSA